MIFLSVIYLICEYYVFKHTNKICALKRIQEQTNSCQKSIVSVILVRIMSGHFDSSQWTAPQLSTMIIYNRYMVNFNLKYLDYTVR